MKKGEGNKVRMDEIENMFVNIKEEIVEFIKKVVIVCDEKVGLIDLLLIVVFEVL